MITVGYALKNLNSIEKFQLEFEEEEINWIGIGSLEQLKENIIISDYDFVILDNRIWWLNECKELLEKKNITITYFNDGLFKPTIDEMEVIITELKRLMEVEATKYQARENNVDNTTPKIQVVEKVVEKIVEKVVYTTKDISKKIFTVVSEDNNSFRDYYAMNLGTFLSSLKNSKSIVIDITLTQNLVNCIKVDRARKIAFDKEDKELNAATILKCCDLINKDNESYLLRIEGDISKALLKRVLFNLRDFENIIFCLDVYNTKIPAGYILALSHKVHIAIEPVYPSSKKALGLLENIKDYGQLKENIKIILTDLVEDLEIWTTLFKNMYEIYQFNRFDVFEGMNEDKALKEKRYRDIFKRIIGISIEKKKISFFRRRD